MYADHLPVENSANILRLRSVYFKLRLRSRTMLHYTYLCVNGSLVPTVSLSAGYAIIYLQWVRCYNSLIKSCRITFIIKLLRNIYEKMHYDL